MTMGKLRRVALGVTALAVTIAASVAVPTAQADTGSSTGIAPTPGKGVGSGQWGFVGDIETAKDTTYTYGLGFSPTDDSLWVTDSGKVTYSNFLCGLAGLTSPCQQGNPRIFKYQRVGQPAGSSDEKTTTDYTGDGVYSSNATYTSSAGRNAGIGAKYATLADRQTVTFPASEATVHGPRDVSFTKDGTAWVVDSEAVAPVGGPAGAIKRFAPDMTPLSGAGWTGPWANRDLPGVHFYRVGSAVTKDNTVLVNSETSDRLQEYQADGTWLRSIKLDVPAGTATPGDPGYRNPYGVTVDPVDGSMYIPLINFRDDTYWKTQQPFLEKRDATGKIIAHIGEGYLPKGQVVFASAVEPTNQHVFVWSQTSAVFEFTKDGDFVRKYTSTQFPGLTDVRDLAFDTNGRMYFTVAQGTSSTRVMILGKTPSPALGTCGTFSSDRTSATLNFACDSLATKTPYQQTPVLDFVVEASTDGGSTWSVLPKAAASTETTRTVAGLDPSATYQFRVSAWNEAGNSDWSTISMVDYKAVDDSASTTSPAPVTIDVRANDTGSATPDSISLVDADGKAVTTLTEDGKGTFTMDGDKVVFTPVKGFAGTVTAPYRAHFADCGLDATITVTVTAPKTSLTLTASGAVPDAWILKATGSDTFGGHTGVHSSVEPGAHALSSTGPDGYTAGAWTCTLADGTPVPVIGDVVNVAEGTDVTCDIRHDIAPTPTPTPTPTVTPTHGPTPTHRPTHRPPGLPSTGN